MNISSAISSSQFEQLPDEIILEICLYLRPYDVLLSFGQLNQRLDRSISQYRRYLDIHHLSLNEYQRWYSYFLPFIAKDVVTVVLSNWNSPGQIRLFNESIDQYGSLYELFPRIRKLHLISFHNDDIDILPKLAMIEKIFIDIDALIPLRQSTEHLLDRYLFCSSFSFQEIRLWIGDGGIRFQHHNDLVINHHLEHLTIVLSHFQDLILIFERAPNLVTLHVQISEYSLPRPTQYVSQELMPKKLMDFHLQILDRKILTFDDLFVLMIHIPSIQYLSLDIDTNDIDYGDGLCWTFLKSRLPYLKLLSFRIRLWIGTGLFKINVESFLDSFRRVQLAVLCYADRRVLQIDTIPYDTYSSSNMTTSVNTSPSARFAQSTCSEPLERSGLTVRTLLLCGRYESTNINDWLHILYRFPSIRALDLTTVNIKPSNDDIICIDSHHALRLSRLVRLRYVRSSRCEINTTLLSFLVLNETVTPSLRALTFMYGDLVHFCKRMPDTIFNRIRELYLFSSDTDGRIIISDIERLVCAFPRLNHFSLFMHSSRAINRHIHTILLLICNSLSEMISFRLVCRRGYFHLHSLSNSEIDSFWNKDRFNLNACDQCHLKISRKEISLWK